MNSLRKICKDCGESLPLSSFYKREDCSMGCSPACKKCERIRHVKYNRTIKGKIRLIYSSQKGNSLQRKRAVPNYTLEEFELWMLSQPNFHLLFDNWVKSGYKKDLSPSSDRVNTPKPYTLANLQLGTFKENHLHENIDMRNGIIGKGKKVIGANRTTGKIVTFVSASEASRQLSIDRYSITHCCVGKRPSAGNYIWRYIE